MNTNKFCIELNGNFKTNMVKATGLSQLLRTAKAVVVKEVINLQ